MDHPGAAMHHVQFIEPLQERFVRRVPSLRGALGPRDRPTPPRRLRRHPLHHVVPDPTSTWHSRSHVAPRGGRPPSPSSPALRGGSHTRPGDSCTTHHHGTTRLARVLGGAPPSRSVTTRTSPPNGHLPPGHTRERRGEEPTTCTGGFLLWPGGRGVLGPQRRTRTASARADLDIHDRLVGSGTSPASPINDDRRHRQHHRAPSPSASHRSSRPPQARPMGLEMARIVDLHSVLYPTLSWEKQTNPIKH